MRYQAIDPSLFIHNRRRLRERLGSGEAVVLRSAKPLPGALDDSHPYRQDSDFFWATGIDQTDCVVVLTPQAETLYIRSANEFERTWMDERLDLRTAAALTGIADVRWLGTYRKPAKIINHKPLMRQLRAVKDPIEIALIRQSIDVTAVGLRDLVAAMKPGLREFEAEAEYVRQIIKGGASNAWPPVIASGPNTCVIHYGRNNRTMLEGDLLLCDVGAEYAHYDADISRTYPVSGHYSSRQRHVYEAVLEVQQQAVRLLRPGVVLLEYEKAVAELMFEALKRLGLAADADKDKDRMGWPKWRRYYPHRTSHHLGLDAHDQVDYELPLEEGMVLTVEPGIYIPEEGIGVRIEDDVLITKADAEVLSASIPSGPDEIESLLAK